MFVRVLVLVALAVFLWAVFARGTGAAGPERAYRVQAGDTLWAIAVEHYGGDPREAIWEIRDRNGLESATIVPGQRLVLP